MNQLLILTLLFSFCQMEEKQEFNILDHGARGDGKTINTIFIQETIDEAHSKGGGIVIFPGDTFLTGTIYLKDNVTLLLKKGAVLLGSPYLKDYPLNQMVTTRSYTERYTNKALIYSEGARNIGIIGKGSINGNNRSEEFMKAEKGSDKPVGIRFVSCKRVTIKDISLSGAGLWLQHYLNCEELAISGITANNHGHFTNDGMNIDGCRNVHIENVNIDSHDDALVFKSTGPFMCENVRVRNCNLKSHCHGLKFGTETNTGFRNFDISNITISPSDSIHPKAGFYWKVITGVAMEITDGGIMENISIKNLTADSVYAPIFIKLGNRSRKYMEDMESPDPGKISGIILSNFRITNAGKYTSSVTGFPGHKVLNVVMENISIEFNEVPEKDELFEEVPENETRYPEITMFTKGLEKNKYLPAYGLYARHVDGLILRNYLVKTVNGDQREKFVLVDVDNYLLP